MFILLGPYRTQASIYANRLPFLHLLYAFILQNPMFKPFLHLCLSVSLLHDCLNSLSILALSHHLSVPVPVPVRPVTNNGTHPRIHRLKFIRYCMLYTVFDYSCDSIS